MSRSYQIGRPPLSLANAVTTAIDSVAVAYTAGEHRRRAAFLVHLSAVLPAEHRSKGTHWAPSADGSLDDWARLGTYQGAVDAWEAAPARQQPTTIKGHKAAVWVAAYSAAYMAVAANLYHYQQSRQVSQ